MMASTNEDLETWLAIRKEAAKTIDPTTAEIFWTYGDITDPYGVDPDGRSECIGRVYFARAPGSDIWVEFGDLPMPVVDEFWKRHKQSEPNSPSPFDDCD